MRSLVVLGTFALGVASATAATFTVTNTSDSGAGSLRDAVALANAAPGADTIDFGVTGTIVLTSGAIQITETLTIQGPGADQLAIDGNLNSRIFSTFESVSPPCPAPTGPSDFVLTISALTLQNGSRNVANSSGGAIASAKSLVLDDVTVQGNTAKTGGGVAFWAQYPGQSLTITNSRFIDNVAKETAPGVTGAHNGGGLMVGDNCPGVRAPVVVTIADSLFSGNRVQPGPLEGRGGGIAIYDNATVTIARTRIVNNLIEVPASFSYPGGGLITTTPSVTIQDSEISGNFGGYGGGISVNADVASLQAPGDAYLFRLINSTVSGNTADRNSGGLHVWANVTTELYNSTVADNEALTFGAGGIQLSKPSGAGFLAPTLKLVSSVLGASRNGDADVSIDIAQIPTLAVDANKSLVQKLCASCTLLGAGNIVGSVPNLGPLVFNGGPTRTQAPLPGSPVMNNGSNPLALTTDQRGGAFARVFGAAADMGAFESTGPVVPGVGFLAPAKYPAGAGAQMVFAGTADFTGDGRAELVAADTTGNSVTVLRNNGDGTFTSQAYTVGSQPALAVACEVTGDAKRDIVVVNKGSDTVSILVNQGDGSFVAAAPLATGDQPLWVNCANSPNTNPVLHNLRVLNGGDGTFMHFQDDGFGNFTLEATVPVGTDPRVIQNLDLDLDGDGDEVVANFGSSSISVARNDGGFAYTVTAYPVQAEPIWVSTADVNGDGNQDIISSNQAGNSVSVLINNGNASFQPAVHYPVGTNPQSHTFGDFNGDGRTDIATRNFGSDDIAVLLNNGDGSFAPAKLYPVGAPPTSTAGSVDLDGDGVRDLVFGIAPDSVALLYGKGDGTFNPAFIIPVGADATGGVQATDLSGDGRPDIVIPVRGESAVAVLLNTADAGAATSGTFYAGPTSTGTGKAAVGFTGGGDDCQFAQAQFVPTQSTPQSPPDPPPAGYTFPQGLAAFALSGCNASASVTITITYPNPLPAGSVYWKYGPTTGDPTPHWYSIPATFSGNTVTFTIPDGGLGDDDLAVNGVIVDAGGPGVPTQPAPVVVGVASRKIHGTAGAFDLPLTGPPVSPTVEPRTGPAHMLVFSFDKPVIGGTVTVTEGTASVGVFNPSDVQKVGAQSIPVFEGGELKVGLSGVPNERYLTVAISNVFSADGGANGGGSVRVGFLAGDVNGTGSVSVADKFVVNNVLSQITSAANFLRDVNLSGSVTLADMLFVNANQSQAFPP